MSNASVKLKDFLSPEEIKLISAKSDSRAVLMLLNNWLIVIAALALSYYWTNPVTVLISLLLIAGRQHGLGSIMHECGHGSFFATKKYNDFFGQWFCAKPVFDDLAQYATEHSKHHFYAGTPKDPDSSNYNAYPVEPASFKRKVIRDLTGQTGFKYIAFKVLTTMGLFSNDPIKHAAAKPYLSVWLTQIAMIAILYFTMSAWLYLLWISATMTVYMLLVRLRQVAEHAAVPNALSKDPRENTRTTHANLIERMLVAPNYVNYHMEHHFVAGIPAYRLPQMHALLTARGAYADTRVFENYLEVIRHVTQPKQPSNTPQPQAAQALLN